MSSPVFILFCLHGKGDSISRERALFMVLFFFVSFFVSSTPPAPPPPPLVCGGGRLFSFYSGLHGFHFREKMGEGGHFLGEGERQQQQQAAACSILLHRHHSISLASVHI
ncbi:hypothetical protein LY76DRAFT_182737 [Colletotrichum caudatum]|nr:hypothetical protein LY76DRAFT_182737 [Colletotrichum caudatum]